MTRLAVAIALAVSLLAIAGCAQTGFATAPPGGYPEVERIDLEVGLVVTSELRNVHAQSLRPDGLEGPPIDVGGELAVGVQEICDAVFTKVVVDDSPPKGVDLLVVPRVVSMRTTRPVFFWEDVPLTVVLEWKVVTPREQLVWFETVRSTGSEWAGFSIPGTQAQQLVKRVNAAFPDLFLRSHAALAGSPEIRAYAAELALAERAE